MPQPYSADLRERVLVAYDHGEGARSPLPAAFAWARPPSATGSAKPARKDAAAPSRTAASRPGTHELALLQGLVAETNDARLDQYAERLFDFTGKWVSRPVMCRTLLRLKLTVKKTLRAAEQERPEIAREREAYRRR